MTIDTLLILRQALAGAVRQGFDISSPDAEKVWAAKLELDRAIETAQAAS